MEEQVNIITKIYRLASDCPGNCGPMPFVSTCQHLDHKDMFEAIYCEDAYTDVYYEKTTLICSTSNGQTWTNLNWLEIEQLIGKFGYKIHPSKAQHLTVTSVYGTHLTDIPNSHCQGE